MERLLIRLFAVIGIIYLVSMIAFILMGLY